MRGTVSTPLCTRLPSAARVPAVFLTAFFWRSWDVARMSASQPAGGAARVAPHTAHTSGAPLFLLMWRQ